VTQSTITKPPETGLAPPEPAPRFPGTKPRMLLIVNPWATSVSARLKNLVVYALRGRYDIEAVETQARDHATALTREAVGEGFDLVVAFGGDGTLNEVVNGIAGTDVPVSVLPGGCTNVVCRMLGIPTDVVDATEHLLSMADEWEPRRVDLGRADDRHFVFASGVGLDASVVRRVDAHPYRKARLGAWYYSWAGVAIFNRSYLINPPRVRVTALGRELEGVTVIIQNSDPFTFFRARPIRVVEPAGLETGSLTVAVLKRATAFAVPTLIPRLFSSRASSVMRHRQVEPLGELDALRVDAMDERRFPVQVDGDYIGEFDSVEYRAVPGGLVAVS
jgi:diacylglycerol kinase family enzyme